MNIFTAGELGLGCGIVMEISYHIIGICEPAVIILVQCNLLMIFQSITVNICCYDKSPKFERKVNDLYTTQKGQIIKIVWNIPLRMA